MLMKSDQGLQAACVILPLVHYVGNSLQARDEQVITLWAFQFQASYSLLKEAMIFSPLWKSPLVDS